MPRDDFSKNVVRRLAMRAGYICSNPACLAFTIGPALGSDDDSVNIGIAAHITAAASGGPRYDDSLSPAKRSSILNGIWLCQNCAKLIDSDPLHFSTEMLLAWKREHTRRIADTIVGRQGLLDQRHVSELARATGQPEAVIEEVLPVPSEVTDELTMDLDVRFMPTRDEIQLKLTFVNLGEDRRLTAVGLTVGDVVIPLDLKTFLLSTDPSSLWLSLESKTGDLDVLLPSGTERTVSFYAKNASASKGLFDEDEGWWLAQVSVNVGDCTLIRKCRLLSNLGAARMAVGKKLRPLQQWICDQCDLPILQASDGWIEWTQDRSSRPPENTGFRIVHHFMASPLKGPKGCYGDRDELTMHLHHVIDAGISWGLGLLGVGEPDGHATRYESVASLSEWGVLVRRLWLPYYEQGRLYITKAIGDDFADQDSSFYSPDFLERIVERYVSSQLAPDPRGISELVVTRTDSDG